MDDQKNEDDLKNEANFKNEDDLRNEYVEIYDFLDKDN